jgi:hypothetical protein
MSRVDWERAFEWWAAGGRTYSEVAGEFGVTKRSVERAAAKHGWQDRRAAIERKARAEADKLLVRERTERVADTLRIIDAARTRFAGQLRTSEFRLTGSDFVGLIKLENLLEGEATERIEPQQVRSIVLAVFTVAGRFVPAERREEFLTEMDAHVAGVLEVAPEDEAA